MKKQKIKVIAVKYKKAKKKINLFNKKEKNYENNIRDKINPN